VAILTTIDVVQAAQWPQGDIRDPLGVWGFRVGITGDATGGSIKAIAQVPRVEASAYIYTCYSLNYSQLTGTIVAVSIKARLLTNWPNVDPVAGIQGYATARIAAVGNDADFTPPIQAILADQDLVGPHGRFILLFDPRNRTEDLPLVEMELGVNTNLATYSFEGYGYFWDRSVLNAPGGPRHPGSS